MTGSTLRSVLVAALLLVALPLSAGADSPRASSGVSAPASVSEDPEVRALVARALEALARGLRALVDDDRPAASGWLAEAHQRVVVARHSLRRPVFASRDRDRIVDLESPRATLRIPLEEVDPEALEWLRPMRPADAAVLRVDLDALERRLAAALAASVDGSLAAARLAAAELSFET